MNLYDYFISYIILNKLIIVLFGIWHYYLVKTNKEGTKLANILVYWKERCEFMFIISMALLCIHLFNPFLDRRVPINRETQILLFAFGIIILITSDWNIFFNESRWLSVLQYFISNKKISNLY